MNTHCLTGVPLSGFLALFINDTLAIGYWVTSTIVPVATGLVATVVSASVHTAGIATAFVSGIAHQRLGDSKNE